MLCRSKVSSASALLALAVAQVALADTTILTTGSDYTNQGLSNLIAAVPSLGSNGVQQLGLSFPNLYPTNYPVNANGNFILSETGTNYSGTLVYYYSGAGASGVLAGPTLTTDSTNPNNINFTYTYNGTAVGPYAYFYPTAGNPAPETVTASPVLGSTGDVIATQQRSFATPTVAWGADATLFTAATGNTTIINDQGILNTVNTNLANGSIGDTGTLLSGTTYSGTVFYQNQFTTSSYYGPYQSGTASSLTQYYRSATATAVNSADEVIGTVNRYTGSNLNNSLTLITGAAGSGLGTDAYVYNPKSTDPNGPVTIIGLTGAAYSVGTATAATNSYTITQTPLSGTSKNNSYIYSIVANAAKSINSSGSVVGTSPRYISATSSSTSAGQDNWLYTPTSSTTSGTTVQVGMVGTIPHAVSAPTLSGTPTTINSYYSAAIGSGASAYTLESAGNSVYISNTGAVAGTSSVYTVPSAAALSGAVSLGTEAWLYTPSATNGAGVSAAYGSTVNNAGVATNQGFYTQLGLTSVAGETTSSVGTPISGYASGTGYHSSSVNYITKTGNAVGSSSRYYTDSGSTSVGTDIYFYNATTGISTNISPTISATNAYSRYVQSATIAGFSSTSQDLYVNNGVGSAAVVADTETRWPTSGSNIGTDGWAYTNGQTYSIMSPAVFAGIGTFSSYKADFTNNEYFVTRVTGVSESGVVTGYVTAYTGTSSSTPVIGEYLWDWTLAGGTNILSPVSASTTSTSAGDLVDPLSTTLPYSTPVTAINAFPSFVDGAGNIYANTAKYGSPAAASTLQIPVPSINRLANGSGTWTNGAANGIWSTNTSASNNWTGGFPNAYDVVATFDDTAVGGPGLVDLSGDKAVGGLVLNTASTGYTLGVVGTNNVLNFATDNGTDATITVTGAATHTLNAKVALNSPTDITISSGSALRLNGIIGGANNLTLNGSGIVLVNAVNTFTGTTTLNGGTLGGSGTIPGSVLAGTGPHTIAPSAGLAATAVTTLKIGSLSTNANTTLAFNLITPGTANVNDTLIITTANGLTLNGGTLQIANTSTGPTSLGYYKAISYTGSIQGTGTAGITLPAISNNIVYTLDTTQDPGYIDIHRGFLGDANDDGKVDLSDLNIVLNNLGNASTSWTTGNFDGAATVDLTDLNDVLNNLGTTDALTNVTTTAVPEPASLSILAAAAVLLGRRKFRRPLTV